MQLNLLSLFLDLIVAALPMRSPMAHFVCRMVMAVSVFIAVDVAKLQ